MAQKVIFPKETVSKIKIKLRMAGHVAMKSADALLLSTLQFLADKRIPKRLQNIKVDDLNIKVVMK